MMAKREGEMKEIGAKTTEEMNEDLVNVKGGDNTNEGNIVVQKSKGGVFFEKGGEVLSIGAEVGGVKAGTKEKETTEYQEFASSWAVASIL